MWVIFMTSLIRFVWQNVYSWKCRIWGDQGQAALEKSNICLLNCGPTGSETLKNLVLGGIGSITVVDGSKVEVGDLGNNFLGTLSSCVLVLFHLVWPLFWSSICLFFCSRWSKPWGVKGKNCVLISPGAEWCS